MKTLRLILGDQLNYRHSWVKEVNRDVTYLVMEMRQETDYVMHHSQKVIGFFAAMYNYAQYLQKQGHRVIHLKINDPENTQSLINNLRYYFKLLNIECFEYQQPDEYRLDAELAEFCKGLTIPTRMYDTEHFLTTRGELKTFFNGKQNYLMEYFYRHLRKKYNVLLTHGLPEGGAWNYDKENREPFKGLDKIPEPIEFANDYSEIWQEIKTSGVLTFGEPCEKKFPWPTTRKQSLAVLNYFVTHLLPRFGKYQDAMHTHQANLFHSRLSFALNVKMLSPVEVIKRIEETWRQQPDKISLSSAEGFIRQILGWREYMRGIYWAEMPGYSKLNYFEHNSPLPGWYWTGKTKMNCLKTCITQSLNNAYAHHIQRLMVTGNFALLAGIHPVDVDKWYLGIYIDAIEWVEITNTRGMSQYADGGLVGTKPYISGAAYINKMSNYCKTCFYDKTQKTGERACPFNSLYWHFLERNRQQLSGNHRLKMMYSVLNKMSLQDRNELMAQANTYLEKIETL